MKEEDTKKNIIVIGASFGGLEFLKRIENDLDKINVTVIEKNQTWTPRNSWKHLVTGQKDFQVLSENYENIKWKNKITFLSDEVIKINTENKTVYTKTKTLNYDYMVISMGVTHNAKIIDGMQEGTYNFHSTNDCSQFGSLLSKKFKGDKIVIGLPKCNNGYKAEELAYEYAFAISNKLKSKKQKVKIQIFSPHERPLPFADESISKFLLERINENEFVEFIPNAEIKIVDLTERKVEISSSNEESKKLKFDAFLASWHFKAPEVLNRSNLLDESGLINVNHNTLESKFEGIYVIGDCSHIVDPNTNKIHPKSTFFQLSQAHVVAERISALVNGNTPKTIYEGKAKFEMVLDNNELLNFNVSVFKNEDSKYYELTEIDTKSEIEKIQRLFGQYFAVFGGKGFDIIHQGLRFHFESTSKLDPYFLCSTVGEKEGSVTGVRTQDGIEVKLSESRFTSMVDGKICVLILNQTTATKFVSQTVRFYSSNDSGEEAKQSMIAWFAHPSQLDLDIQERKFYQHEEELDKKTGKTVQHNFWMVHYMKKLF
eukprot:TRINITY_DN12418_c0_g1_i1.p1 TRINITY_DN12418_c0_g1~~TRINITY_DN12418_c0_g1_i1.p1  ORF type:complete len:543 (+),score=153.33 TRINITY_DN12418_c0_g1_i1:63-1691(+)